MNFGDERLPQRFWEKCVPVPEAGCWLWLAALNSAGYGMASVDGTWGLAHRHAYRALHGSIPEGADLDHLCRNTACCNPQHLEAVSHGENIRRGSRHRNVIPMREARRAIKTCANGHPFDGHDGHQRTCATCRRAARRRYKERKRNERASAG